MTPRKKRIYLTLIALSALGLIVDRLAVPAPGVAASPAAPAPPAEASAGLPTQRLPETAGAGPVSAVLAAAPFPEKLRNAAPPARDLFEPTEQARRSLIGQGPSGGAGAERTSLPADQARLVAERFMQAHELSAVVNDGEFIVAILDGMWVRIGAEFDGCILTRIEGRRAIFDCGGAAVELSVGRVEGWE